MQIVTQSQSDSVIKVFCLALVVPSPFPPSLAMIVLVFSLCVMYLNGQTEWSVILRAAFHMGYW